MITLALDFTELLRFPAAQRAGVMVLRPQRSTLGPIRETLVVPVSAIDRERLTGRPWIVETGRIRTHCPRDEGDD
ncbi:MAG: hypothetical protein RMK02_09685 [Burkholderiales bacterium]|nr:hypothetical protein [Burkholderiales bacterium]